jgi:hypothetical protein
MLDLEIASGADPLRWVIDSLELSHAEDAWIDFNVD